jgi:hypothetical protein
MYSVLMVYMSQWRRYLEILLLKYAILITNCLPSALQCFGHNDTKSLFILDARKELLYYLERELVGNAGLHFLLNVILVPLSVTEIGVRRSSPFLDKDYFIFSRPRFYSCISVGHCLFYRPPLWSNGQSSWLQIQRSAFDSRCY